MVRTALLVALTAAAVGSALTGSALAGVRPGGALIAQAGAAETATAPTRPSTREQLAVSVFLRQRGALFYGAWWCPHCVAQKSLFGKEGAAQLPYVECDKTEAGRQRCIAAKVRAFPTWELDGKRVEGVQTVEQLKLWSGYPGGGRGSGAN